MGPTEIAFRREEIGAASRHGAKSKTLRARVNKANRGGLWKNHCRPPGCAAVVSGMDEDDPGSPENMHELLKASRRNFPGFYLTASEQDAGLLDGLVLAHVALATGINAPLEFVAPVIREQVERTTDATERVFMDFREAVRACPTFARVSIGEQIQIVRVLLNVSPPA